MVDLRSIRKQIRDTADPAGIVKVSRRWLEEVEKDLTELGRLRSKESR